MPVQELGSGSARSRAPLRTGMSVEAFDSGYYYAAELKDFAREIGIKVGNFRKVELEELIREYLVTGRAPTRKPTMPRRSGKGRDPLLADAPVVDYVGDKKTKSFLLALVQAVAPGLKDKSGQWYWLNDWRRKQQEAGVGFTYLDLADHLRGLMQTEGRLPQIPSARMNNFISDLRADPANANLSRDEIMAQWRWLKNQPGPKTYAEYRRLRPQNAAT